MPIIELSAAKQHLRLESDYPDLQVSQYLGAAVLSASEFLNRKVFATQGELDAAVAAVPAALTAAGITYTAAIVAADAIADCVVSRSARAAACRAYRRAQTDAGETYAGIVVNDLIKAGILLTLGHLFENRQDVLVGSTAADLPMGARSLLQPYRVGLGV